MEIGVMYDDQSIVWSDFADIATLRKEDVLFISMTTERGNRAALVTRLWDRFNGGVGPGWYGSDNYAVGVDPVDDVFFVNQWNDGHDSFRVRSISDPHGSAPVTRLRIKTYPSRYTVQLFIGKAVDNAAWAAAVAKFEAEMF